MSKEKDTKAADENKNADVADTSLTAQQDYANGSDGSFDGNREPDERKDMVPAETEEVESRYDDLHTTQDETKDVLVTSVQSSIPNDSGVKSANASTNMTSDIQDEEARIYNKLPADVIEREQKNQEEAAKVNKLNEE